MAWFRVPRSFRTYLVISLIMTMIIITFPSSNNIGRLGATNPNPSFLPLTASPIGNPHMSSTLQQRPSIAQSPENLYSPSQVESTNQSVESTPLHSPRNQDTHETPVKDFHTTSVDLSNYSMNISSSSPSSSLSSSATKPKIFSDTIIITPIPPKSPLSDVATTSENLSNSQPSLISTNASNQLNSLLRSPTYSQSFNSSRIRSMRELSSEDKEQAEFKRNFIRDMIKHAWHGYADYAWGFNEVRPVSKAPHTESIFGGEKLGATIVDGIDTLYIAGLKDEYLAAKTWIEDNLDFEKFDSDLSVFETNIRYVGGLLSIHALTKDRMYLNKAVQIADKLLPAFDTPSGIPQSNVNLKTGYSHNHNWAYGAAILSEFGSMHLEFIYLSQVTGDPKYRDKVMKIRNTIKKAVPREDGLYNNYINTDSGQWLTRPTHISMGGLGDSFYEYLLKAYVQSGGRDIEAYQMYMDAMKAFENKLIFTSTQSRLVYFAELKDTSINHKMDSLACFSGGMLALGAIKSEEPERNRHMNLANGIANTCHESCIRSASHLGPEAFYFSSRADAIAYGPTDKYYILRPEIVETYFYMWRFTHDPKYRNWAWDFAQALERYCKSDAGYSGLRNVYQPFIKDDVQQSFFIAEVLKYLYLIFSEDNLISFDDWVFNTEAHPLPIIKR